MQEYVELYKSMLETSNEKAVINHIYFDEENMVATDTRILLVHKHNMDIATPFAAVNPKVKKSNYTLFDRKNAGTIKIGKVEWIKKEVDDYPKYDRILLSEKSSNVKIEELSGSPSGLDILYLYSYNESIVFNYVAMSPFMKRLSAISFDRIYFVEKDNPIMLENSDLKVVIMPIVYKNGV